MSLVVLSVAISSRADDSASAVSSGAILTSIGVRHHKPAEVEIRFEFYPTGPYDDSVVPILIATGQDGRARAVRYQLRDQTKNIASYEGVLPRDNVQRLFARVRAALRLPKHRRDYDRRLIYEGNGFYLALRSRNGRVMELSGNLEIKPDEVRTLVTNMRELWKQLKEMPPAYAYLTSRTIETDRLTSLRRKYQIRLTPIESLPAHLQSLLIPIVTRSRNFYPLTQVQYTLLNAGMLAVSYNRVGYELTLLLSVKEATPKRKG